jgi:hypothetical protein
VEWLHLGRLGLGKISRAIRYRGTVKRRYFCGDAASANPEIYEFLEAEGYGYANPATDQSGRLREDRIPALTSRRSTAA